MATLLHRLVARHAETPLPVGWGRVSMDVPDVGLVDARTGGVVNLRSLFGGTEPVLLWFMSPF